MGAKDENYRSTEFESETECFEACLNDFIAMLARLNDSLERLNFNLEQVMQESGNQET